MGSDYIVYVPPALFGFVALAFFILWRMKIATSWQWSAGFAQTATGFGFSTFPIEPVFDAFVSGLIFIGAAYCYGSAVLLHFSAPMRRLERRLFVLGYVLIHAYVVFISANLRDELLLTDVAFACLLGAALYWVTPRASRPADIILIIAGAIVVVDTLARTTFFYFFAEASDQLADFVNSNYNLAVHITTMTVCMLFPFSALGAMASAAIDRHRDAAQTDTLTGLFNRRGFHEVVDRKFKHKVFDGAVLVCDIDNFKQVNDTYGHAVGDKVIEALAQELLQTTKSCGYAARFGGEEFVVFLPGLSQEDAAAIAQLLRVGFCDHAWGRYGIEHAVTVSFGVSAIEANELALQPAINRADQALYSAKVAGRNKVVLASAQRFSPSLAENSRSPNKPTERISA